MNSIFVYMASELMIKILYSIYIGAGDNAMNAYDWISKHCFQSWLSPWNGSTLFALLTVLFWWLVLYGMSRRRWFIKI